jgi:hypothetical protein
VNVLQAFAAFGKGDDRVCRLGRGTVTILLNELNDNIGQEDKACKMAKVSLSFKYEVIRPFLKKGEFSL